MGRRKLANLLDQYVPVRSLLTWLVFGVSLIIGGAKIEALMVQQYDAMTSQMAVQSAQLTAQEVKLEQIVDTITASKAARDAQVKQMQTEFAGLSSTVSDNHDDTGKQFSLLNDRIDTLAVKQQEAALQIGNIVQDLAVIKCKALKRC